MNKKLFRYIGVGICLIILVCCLFQIASGYQLTLYPIMDGQQSRVMANAIFYNITQFVGTTSSNTGTTATSGIYTTGATISNNFSESRKSILVFDISSLPSGAIVSSAYISLVLNAKTTTLGSPQFVIVNVTPTNYLLLQTIDYNNYSRIELTDRVNMSNWDAGYIHIFNLNNNGLSEITRRYNSKYIAFGLDTSWNLNNATDSTYTWGVSRSAVYTYYMQDQIDSINDPALIITYSLDSSGSSVTLNNPNQEEFYGNLNYYFLMGIIVIILICAIWLESLIAYAGIVLSIGGLTSSIDKGFTFAFAYVLLLIISCLIAFKMGD